MLEQIISKPTNSAVLQQESRQRQALPTLSGFADLLKASLPSQSGKSPLAQLAVQNSDKTSVTSILLGSSSGHDVGLDKLGQSSTAIDAVINGNGLVSEPFTADLLSAEAEQSAIEDLPGGFVGTLPKAASALNDPELLDVSESVSPALGSVEETEDPVADDFAGNVPEITLQDGEEQAVNKSIGSISVVDDGSSSNRVETTLPTETNPSVEQTQQTTESSEDDTILATAIIEPGKAVVTATGGSEKLGDHTSEIRQENRTLKQNSNAEPPSQNATAQKGSGSDESGQQSRGQSMQQQFMNMAQSTSQNTQVTREQQVERQFSTILNDRVANQVLSQTMNEVEATKLNNPAVASERRGLLPVGLQSIGLPVTHQKWGQALGQRVVYMASQQLQQAQITLNPEKLGPVQIRLQIDHDQKVNVVMTAQHGVTREAMEAAMPRLREMLEQAGIDVGSVDVNDQKQFADSEKEASENQQASSTNSANGDEVDGALEGDDPGVTTYSTDNIVDYYA